MPSKSLSQQVLDKINELGTQEASSYFGRRESTIKMWVKTKKVPIEAAELLLDAKRIEAGDSITAELTSEVASDLHLMNASLPAPNGATADEVAAAMAATHQRFLTVEDRIDKLEMALLQRVAAPPSLINPVSVVSTTSVPNPPNARPQITGIAPTREQAEGEQVGLPAGPATAAALKPGDPGNWDWLTPKPPRGAATVVRSGH